MPKDEEDSASSSPPTRWLCTANSLSWPAFPRPSSQQPTRKPANEFPYARYPSTGLCFSIVDVSGAHRYDLISLRLLLRRQRAATETARARQIEQLDL